MLGAIDLHWAAGFLEGEGAFMAVPMRGKYKISQADWVRWNPVVDAAQVNIEPLEKLQRLFGGSIFKQSRPKGNRQQAHSWRLNGRMAIAFMMTMWALMSDKRRGQIEVAIARWKENSGQSGEIYMTSRPRGAANGNVKLTEIIVREILASSEGPVALGKKYGVSQTLVSNIRAGRAWKHIPRTNRQVA